MSLNLTNYLPKATSNLELIHELFALLKIAWNAVKVELQLFEQFYQTSVHVSRSKQTH
jgi:hypothetical protein